MSELPICSCEFFWGSHHEECPARRAFEDVEHDIEKALGAASSEATRAAELEQRLRWQPIATAPKVATAPKDGIRILLAFISNSDYGYKGIIVKDPTPKVRWACSGYWSDKYVRFWDGVEPCGLANLTHWMPLPEPSQEQEKEQ